MFSKSYYLSVELEHKAYWAIQMLKFDLKAVDDKKLLQLNELDELRLEAYESSQICKKRTKRWHD